MKDTGKGVTQPGSRSQQASQRVRGTPADCLPCRRALLAPQHAARPHARTAAPLTRPRRRRLLPAARACAAAPGSRPAPHHTPWTPGGGGGGGGGCRHQGPPEAAQQRIDVQVGREWGCVAAARTCRPSPVPPLENPLRWPARPPAACARTHRRRRQRHKRARLEPPAHVDVAEARSLAGAEGAGPLVAAQPRDLELDVLPRSA